MGCCRFASFIRRLSSFHSRPIVVVGGLGGSINPGLVDKFPGRVDEKKTAVPLFSYPKDLFFLPLVSLPSSVSTIPDRGWDCDVVGGRWRPSGAGAPRSGG